MFMNQSKISSGIGVIDKLLNGGFEKDVLSTIYGPAGSGKSNIGLCLVANTLRQGKKVIFIDTEGSFSVERIKQIFPQFEDLAGNLLFLKPTNFEEQKMAFETLHRTLNVEKKQFDVIIIDSIAMLYRLEIGKTQDIYNINRELGRQLGQLTELARRRNIPIIITNQVYSDFESDAVKMVGGDLLKYSSKCLIELKNHEGYREAILRKHRSIAEKTNIKFNIVNEGLIEFNEESED